MSFFKKLFSQKGTSPAEPNEASMPATSEPAPEATTPTPAGDSTPAPEGAAPAQPRERKFLAYDAFGRQVVLGREEWLKNVIPQQLKNAWDQPEQLGTIILHSVADGLVDEMIAPAEHLVEIDPNRERSTVLLASVYGQANRLADAEYTLKSYLAQHGDSAVVLANLAKVFSLQKNDAEVLPTLWHSLELDPNQDTPLSWYALLVAEKDGDDAGLAALRRIAALHGSWRAQFWLARYALTQKQLETALSYYDEILEKLPRPVPAELLAQISADLGQANHIEALLKLTIPLYDIAVHGLYVGANLLKAYLAAGKPAEARTLLDQLLALDKPEWRQALSYWDTQILRAEIAKSGQPIPPKMGTIMVEGPIWLRKELPIVEFCPTKAENAPNICFVGSTVEVGASPQKPIPRILEIAGRLSRAVPLFLSEQLHLRTPAIGTVLQPWVHAPRGTFALFNKPILEAEAAAHTKASGTNAEFVFATHLIATGEQWHITLRMTRVSNGALVNATSIDFDPKKPEPAIRAVSDLALNLCKQHAGIEAADAPAFYQLPAGDDFVSYVLRLEQALNVSFCSIEGVGPGFLIGESDILQGNLFLCLNQPENPLPRIVLSYIMLQLKIFRRSTVEQFYGRFDLLQKQFPLPEPGATIIDKLLQDL